jgi:osmotically-inducible protein OsmY
MKTDSEIQQAVLQELKWDGRVEETEVGVQVSEGVVTLSGTVDTYAKRLAAQAAAHRVAGVLDVANDLQVQIPSMMARTDTDVALAVRRALEWDVLVPDKGIRSTVTNGRVTLEGSVEFPFQREDAARAIRNLAGVRGVVNQLAISAPHVDANVVRTGIEEVLERRAEREAKRIKVTVSEGTVTLTGSVNSWLERQAVLGAARSSPGVRSVEDHLRVERYT